MKAGQASGDPMTRVLGFVSAIIVAAMCLASAAGAQNVADQLRDYTRQIGGDGLELSLVHLNAKTVPLLFQAPTLYTMRSRAAEATLFYVQGTAQRNVELDTTNFTIEQGGDTIAATPINITNFENGTVSVRRDDRVDGVLSFEQLIDVSEPFVVRHGPDSVEFRFTDGQIRDITPAAPQP
jgi:hypothetical protein